MNLPRLRPFRLILPIVVSGLIACGAAAFGQQPESASEMPFRELPGPASFTGVPVMINAAYGTRNQVELPPSDILLIVPQSDGIRSTPGGKASGQGGLVIFDFADETRSHLAERLHLFNLKIPENALDQKIAWAGLVLRDTLVPFVTRGFVDIEWFDFYRTKIGDADAVSAHLGMRNPQADEYRFFYVTILLDPRKDGSVFAVHTADRTISPVKGPEDIGIKGNAIPILRSLTFVVRP